ncbi:Helix-turn-helix [Burkholderia sp. GAS332]|nr:Helix-turn-helix [Burkholderia sp. GAS332]
MQLPVEANTTPRRGRGWRIFKRQTRRGFERSNFPDAVLHDRFFSRRGFWPKGASLPEDTFHSSQLHRITKQPRPAGFDGSRRATANSAEQGRRYEAGSAQPTLEALTRLAQTLNVSLDELVFDENERGPSDDLRLQFEAVSQMPDEDRNIIKALLDGMILRHRAKQIISG